MTDTTTRNVSNAEYRDHINKITKKHDQIIHIDDISTTLLDIVKENPELQHYTLSRESILAIAKASDEYLIDVFSDLSKTEKHGRKLVLK